MHFRQEAVAHFYLLFNFLLGMEKIKNKKTQDSSNKFHIKYQVFKDEFQKHKFAKYCE